MYVTKVCFMSYCDSGGNLIKYARKKWFLFRKMYYQMNVIFVYLNPKNTIYIMTTQQIDVIKVYE